MSKQVFIPLSAIHLSPKPPYPAILALGFRPFYLLAAIWVVASLPLWMLMWGHGFFTQSHLQGMLWHAHELIFGFACAVIVGFLFTAVKNWTAYPTPHGYPLAGIALLWVLTRVFSVTAWSELSVLFEALFFVSAALGIGVPLYQSGNKRNYFFALLLLVLGTLATLHHLSALGLVGLSPRGVLHVALGIIAIIITIMAGRVVPMFTANAVQGAPVKRWTWLESLAIAGIILSIVSMVILPIEYARIVLLLTAGVHLFRWYHWAPFHTLKNPLLWVLHFAYVCLPLALLILAMPKAWLPMNEQFAIHTFTVGTIMGLCIGMMTRTARGHTGRPLRAGKAETTAYALVFISVMMRVMLPMLFPGQYQLWAGLASLPVVIAFAIYVAVYLPWLSKPRADGKPG